jgi:sulfur carrier protein
LLSGGYLSLKGTERRIVMVLINGNKEQAAGKTIAGIVEEYNYDIKTIAVELNEEIVSKCDYSKTILKEDDVVEVVSFVGGG